MATKAKKPTAQQLCEKERKRCVELAKKISKIKNPKCKYCGMGKPQRMVHSHHLFSEGLNKAMSADIDNLITLCWIHHLGGLKFVSTKVFSFHGAPADATTWFAEKEPELYKELRERSRNTKPLDIYFWKKKRILLEQILSEII